MSNKIYYIPKIAPVQRPGLSLFSKPLVTIIQFILFNKCSHFNPSYSFLSSITVDFTRFLIFLRLLLHTHLFQKNVAYSVTFSSFEKMLFAIYLNFFSFESSCCIFENHSAIFNPIQRVIKVNATFRRLAFSSLQKGFRHFFFATLSLEK